MLLLLLVEGKWWHGSGALSTLLKLTLRLAGGLILGRTSLRCNIALTPRGRILQNTTARWSLCTRHSLLGLLLRQSARGLRRDGRIHQHRSVRCRGRQSAMRALEGRRHQALESIVRIGRIRLVHCGLGRWR